jgi:hypothetical protein
MLLKIFDLGGNGNHITLGAFDSHRQGTCRAGSRIYVCIIFISFFQKSFQREKYLDWCMYNHLVLRVRGDGRSYLLNISTAGYFDITWNDVYHYVLYTRGGPYWQETRVRIPVYLKIQYYQCHALNNSPCPITEIKRTRLIFKRIFATCQMIIPF